MLKLREVIRVQKVRLRNPNDNSLFPKPDRWRQANLNEVAEFVHDEVRYKQLDVVKCIEHSFI